MLNNPRGKICRGWKTIQRKIDYFLNMAKVLWKKEIYVHILVFVPSFIDYHHCLTLLVSFNIHAKMELFQLSRSWLDALWYGNQSHTGDVIEYGRWNKLQYVYSRPKQHLLLHHNEIYDTINHSFSGKLNFYMCLFNLSCYKNVSSMVH